MSLVEAGEAGAQVQRMWADLTATEQCGDHREIDQREVTLTYS